MKVCDQEAIVLEPFANSASMDKLLVADLSSTSHPVSKSMSGNKATSVLLPSALPFIARTSLCRPPRMDGNLWRSFISPDLAPFEARGLPI